MAGAQAPVASDQQAGRGPRGLGQHSTRSLSSVSFVGPAVVLFLVFFAWPLVSSLIQSFQIRVAGETQWAGLAQYERLAADPLVQTSLFNAALILVVQVPIMIGLALVLAVTLAWSWLRFRATLRLVYFLPAVTTLVAYSIVFRVLLRTDSGVVNQVLGAVGIAPIDWLNDPFWARVTLIASITWRWTGYNMVILLAGLQGIPQEIYEAASIDGAGAWAAFRRITIPLLRPVILFTIIMSTIATFQLFDENYILTRGGPANATLTPVLYLYKVAFRGLDFNYASAIAWILVLIIGAISFLQFRYVGSRD
jgi:lactose/L-arabinose transport system permease protein